MNTSKPETLAEDWPKASQYKRSIRMEFALFITGIILVLMLVTGYVISNQYVKTVTRGVVEKLLVQSRSYSGPAGKLIISAGGPDVLLLNSTCKKLASDNPDVYWAGISGPDGVFIAHTDIKQVVSSARAQGVISDQVRDVVRPEEGFRQSGDTVYISVPIREKSIHLGDLVVAASGASISGARTASIKTVASITLIMILLGLPITMIALHRKLKPVSLISSCLRSINFGDIAFDIPVYCKNEFGFLAETIRVMGSKLNVAQKDLIEKERISRELEIAREIQENILPKGYPQGSQFEFAGTYRSAKEVGGDYYDFIQFDENHLGILVADVSGKSLPGMLVMLLTRDIVRQVTRDLKHPADILAEINEELLRGIKKGMFVTMFLAVVDLTTGNLSFASAGHNPLLILHSDTGKCESVKTKGFPLGMVPTAAFVGRIERSEMKLQPGDWIVQYTDGVNEALNENEEEFGMERLVQLAESNCHLHPADLIKTIVTSHEEFVGEAEQYDDITLLAMRWNGELANIGEGLRKKVENAT